MKPPKPSTNPTCHCTVSLVELAGHLGATDAHARDMVVGAGYEVATDWAGRAAVGVEVAAEVFGLQTAAREDHDHRWRDYQDYLAARRRTAEDERQAEIAKARADALDHAHRFGKAAAAQAEREALQAAEQAAAERAAKAGKPVPWDTFSKSA